MKKIVTLLIVCFAIQVNAQIHPDGTVITSFSATDIKNTLFSSSTTTANGKHFIIDISATWCTNCWFYHGTKVLDNYNDQYGPNGILAQDAVVLFYEGDYSTDMNDMNGIGTNTVGDWVTGSNYLLFNESTPSNVISSFTGNGLIGFPTVFVVCSDNKMYRISTGIVDAAQVRSFVEQKCGMAPLSASTVHAMDFSYDLYPNPSPGNLNLKLNLAKALVITYEMFNVIGQKVLNKNLGSIQGTNEIALSTSNLPAGIYFFNLNIDGQKVTEKIIIE